MSPVNKRLLVFLFPLVLSAPFLRRALFVDDAFFVRIASWLKDHPGRPYDFPEEDPSVSPAPDAVHRSTRIVNPLLHHYYLALLMKVGGNHLWFWRLGCVAVAGLGLVFVFGLAERWTVHPGWATALVALTPACWLTAHSLLIDSTLGCLFFGALLFFVRGGERDSPGDFVVSGLLMGAAVLAKYTGILIVPLTLAWAILAQPRPRRPWLVFLSWAVAATIFLAFAVFTRRLYGASHVWASSRETLHLVSASKAFVFLVFLPGVTLIPLAVWLLLDRRRALGGAVLILLSAVFLSGRWGGFRLASAALLSLWFWTGIFFLGLAVGPRRVWKKAEDAFLAVWLAAFAAMMAVVMSWVAARYYVIAVPAVVFAAVRAFERKRPGRETPRFALIAGAMFVVSLVLAYADYEQAETSREVAGRLAAAGLDAAPRRFFLGGTFTTGGLTEAGWRPLAGDRKLEPEDRVVVPVVTTAASLFFSRRDTGRVVGVIDFPTHFPVKLMDSPGDAGFYGSAWGPLPFSISSSPWERFLVFDAGGPGTESEER